MEVLCIYLNIQTVDKGTDFWYHLSQFVVQMLLANQDLAIFG